ncbi:unnamed protein product [Rotaria sp. Silwood2]|nr:unnamed protein product [Rotaria sp. Silwood2]
MDIYDKVEYNNILNSGVIALGGLLCEIDEYLPAPKILICTKCNCPGHTRKSCRLDYERCRRCGNNRSNGDHKKCDITCHHCGGEHQANDYKCPILLQFRRDLIQQLRENPNRLPPHIQMFIPQDCRTQKSERSLTNQNTNDNLKVQQNFTYANSTSDWPYLKNLSNTYSCNIQLKELQTELDSLKLKYQLETEKINNKFQHLSNNIQKTCLLMQTQINTQKEMIDTTTTVIKDLAFNMNTNVVNILNNFIQLISEIAPNDKAKNKLNMWYDHLKIQNQLISEKQISFNNHIDSLNKLWLKQSNNIVELLDLYLPANNNDQ